MKLVRVSLKERSYPILVGRGLQADCGRILKRERLPANHAVIVTQKEVARHYEAPLLRSLESEGFQTSVFMTPSGKSSEAAKSQAVYSQLIRHLASQDGKNKAVFLIALGGGVVGDLTGFAASVYRRGIPYVQLPTTLTAQVDSAIGGKTGIDLPEGKNLLGTIYQPAMVLCDTSALDSLPERHWSDGSAEVIKYGVIRDVALFNLLEKKGKDGIKGDAPLLEKVIHTCARIKSQVVQNDELDKKNIRIILNFGHTAGHAIEAASRFSSQYTHGEAVAVGMLVACDISSQLGILKDASLTERLEKTLLKFGLPLFYKGLSLDTVMKAMGYDKKSEEGKNRFVLPIALGKVTVERDVPAEVIRLALEKRKA